MAIVASDPNIQSDQQQKGTQDPYQQDKAIQPVNVSGSAASSTAPGATPSASPTGVSATGQAQTPTSSGRFQNLQAYLKANVGYNQPQGGLAGQMAQSLGQQEQQQEQQIGQEQQRVQQEAAKATSVYDPTKIQSLIQQAQTDPTKVNQSEWQQAYGGSYATPQGYDVSGNLGAQQEQFRQTAGLAGSESGRAALLQKLYATPGYSQGQQSLDQLLLQSQPGQLPALLQQAQAQQEKLTAAGTTAQQQAQQNIAAGQEAAKTGSAALQQALAGNISESQKALQQRAADVTKQRSDYYSQLADAIAKGSPTSQQAQQLGISPITIGGVTGDPLKLAQAFGLHPSDYLTQNAAPVTVGQIATPEDQAKFAALAQLSGQPVSSAIGQFAASSAQPLGQVGTFDIAALQNALAPKLTPAGIITAQHALEAAPAPTPFVRGRSGVQVQPTAPLTAQQVLANPAAVAPTTPTRRAFR